MKIFGYILVVLVCFSFCTSCSKSDYWVTDLSGLTESQEPNNYQSTCMNDLSFGANGLSVCNTREWEKWDVTLVSDEYVFKNSGSDQSAPPGMFPPALRVGQDDWEDYSISFDFFIGTSGQVSFVLYDNSNIFSSKDSYFDGDQRFWFTLLSNGKISFETTSIVDSYYLKDANGDPLVVEDFDPNTWNTISLRNKNGDLSLLMNGNEVTKISQFSDIHRGRFALGGSTGCMFKNIYVE